MDVETWDELAQRCASLDKGVRLSVHGRLRVIKYVDSTQVARKRVTLVASDIAIVSPDARSYGAQGWRATEDPLAGGSCAWAGGRNHSALTRVRTAACCPPHAASHLRM